MAKIGFIGLGRMGRPMAGNMQQKGFSLLVHDIVDAPVQELVASGEIGSVAMIPSEVTRKTE